jgi:hypothetical protein
VKSLLPAVLLLLQAVISVRLELVTVPVTVTDTHGQQVNGLVQENFRVFENGRPQPIAVFHHGDAPVTLGLVVDRSQSMRPKNDALLTTLSVLLQTSRPDDEGHCRGCDVVRLRNLGAVEGRAARSARRGPAFVRVQDLTVVLNWSRVVKQ